MKRQSVVAIVAICALAMSCTTSGTSSGASPSPTGAVSTFGEAAGPVDHIDWGLPNGEPASIDPPNTADYSASFVADNLCEPLERLEPDYSIVSGLATLDQVDPVTMVYTLTDGVTFWDGTPLTPDDVVWSLEYSMEPTSIVSFLYSNVDSIEATGEREVTIHLKAPDALLRLELATFVGAIQQKEFSETAGDKLGSASRGVMCTGPYELERWTPGQSIELKANPDYWDPSRAARVQTVTLTFNTDSASLAQALVSGELDGAYEVPPAIIPTLQKSDTGHLIFGAPSQLGAGFWFATNEGIFGNADFRKAFLMTIDGEAIASGAFHGAGQPNYTHINAGSWNNESLPAEARQLWSDAYDGFVEERSEWGSASAIDEAKQLAASAGYAGEPIVIATLAGDATESQIAQVIQAGAQQAGFNVKIKPLQAIDASRAFYSAKAREELGVNALIGTNFNNAPDPLELIGFGFGPNAFYNYTDYSNRRVTQDIVEARGTLDPVERSELLIDAQSIYQQAYTGWIYVEYYEIVFLNDRLCGAITSFAYLNSPSLAAIGACS